PSLPHHLKPMIRRVTAREVPSRSKRSSVAHVYPAVEPTGEAACGHRCSDVARHDIQPWRRLRQQFNQVEWVVVIVVVGAAAQMERHLIWLHAAGQNVRL